MENTNEFLTNKDAAKVLHSSEITLWRLRKEGLPFYRIASKILFKRSDLESFIEANRKTNGGKYDAKR